MAAASDRSWLNGQENSGQFGLEFSSVLVTNIPPSVTRQDLESHFDKEHWRGDPRVKMMSAQAIVTFKSPSCAMGIARKGHITYNGIDLTVEPYIEVFSTVTAVMPSTLCDHLPNHVIDRLKRKTGVQVIRSSKENNTIEIMGSLLEIEQAQTMLRQRFATIISEKLQTGFQPPVGPITSNLQQTDEYNHTKYKENYTTPGYSEADTHKGPVKTATEKDAEDREIKKRYQTNGLYPDLVEDVIEDDSRNGRSRTVTRKTSRRSSSLSRVETSSRTDKKTEPADIIEKGLYNRSLGIAAATRPHTQPVLSNRNSTASSKSQTNSTARKLKTSSNPILPSKTLVPGTSAATSYTRGRSITGSSSSKSKQGRPQGAVGGLGVSYSTTSKRKAHSVHNYKGVKVSVVYGDLTEERVDVIVSSVGGDLKSLGGVAGAISRAGGPSIQEDCDRYRRRHGPLKTTECMTTRPGRLPCDHIIHTAGPVFQSRHPSRTEEELKETTLKVLTSAAVELNAQSIALPAISSGTFRVPKDMCARAMLSGIMAFAETQREILSSLRDIRIVDNDFYTVLDFSSHCEKLLAESSDRDSTRGSRRRSSSLSRADRRSRTSDYGSSPSNTSNVPAASGANAYGSSYDDSYQSLSNSGKHFRDENDLDQENTAGTPFPSQSFNDRSTKNDGQQDETCPICMCDFTDPKALPCKHTFCAECLATALKHASKCPICGLVVGRLRGDQPDGRMEYEVEKYSSLPGYPSCGTIIIHYSIPSGIQGPEHPNPGHPYQGTSRKAYLPNNSEGQEVLTLLKEAWKNKLVFTVGTSVTTGTSDAVTWNDIHHKTNRSGGPTRYGYPDHTYLGRVKEELAAKGITTRPSTA